MKNTNSIGEDSVKLLSDRKITIEIRQRAENELNESPETREKCLQELKSLIKEEADLIANVDDDFLLQFLRARKFKTNLAFALLKKFYRHRVGYPTLYKNYTPKQNVEVMKANIQNFLPVRTSEDCAIWISRMGAWDTKAFDIEQLLRLGLLLTEKALQNPVTQISGVVSVLDLQGFSWTHIFHLPPSIIRCFVAALQDSFPMRHKAIHIVNNPAIFGLLFAVIRPFLTHKIASRIYFHGYNLESFHQYLSPNLLPEELGGTQGPFKNDEFFQELLDSDNYFLNNQKYGYITTVTK